MSDLTSWIEAWLGSRDLPRGIDPTGRFVASVEEDSDGTTVREIRVARTNGNTPLVVFQVHSADRISETHAPQVHAACNRWNATQRVPRAWVAEGDATLKVVVETSIPEAALTEECVVRTGNVTIDAATAFWRWVDLKTDW